MTNLINPQDKMSVAADLGIVTRPHHVQTFSQIHLKSRNAWAKIDEFLLDNDVDYAKIQQAVKTDKPFRFADDLRYLDIVCFVLEEEVNLRDVLAKDIHNIFNKALDAIDTDITSPVRRRDAINTLDDKTLKASINDGEKSAADRGVRKLVKALYFGGVLTKSSIPGRNGHKYNSSELIIKFMDIHAEFLKPIST